MKVFTLFFWVLFFVSCQSKPQQQTTTVAEKSDFSIARKHKETQPLDKSVSKKFDNWQEYEAVENFLVKFKSISPNEALNNSKELSDLVRNLRDSIKPDFLESPAFHARVNLLYNETLRLYDMSSISAIEYNEVNTQVEKLLEAFASVNSKINIIARQIELDNQVNDPKFSWIAKDSVPERVTIKEEIQETKKRQKMNPSKEQQLKNRKLQLKEVMKKEKNEKKKNN